MTNAFINCTQHKLTEEQIEKAKQELNVVDFYELRNLDDYLFAKLSNTPDDIYSLFNLAEDLIDTLEKEFIDEEDRFNKYDEVYIHLPIGSPAFMWSLAERYYNSQRYIRSRFTPVFSHTDRIVKEELDDNGNVVKKSIFKFKKFIVIR